MAVAADLQAHGSFTQRPKSSSEFTGCASGNLFTYTFGPQIKYRAGKLEPFAEVLLGGAHTNFYANACNQNTGGCGSRSPSNNAFALAIGGGVDSPRPPTIAILLLTAIIAPHQDTPRSQMLFSSEYPYICGIHSSLSDSPPVTEIVFLAIQKQTG
jgi:hypothetical protein